MADHEDNLEGNCNITTLNSALDWEDFLADVEIEAQNQGCLANFNHVRAGAAVGVVADGQRGMQKWRNLKKNILKALGTEPKTWFKN